MKPFLRRIVRRPSSKGQALDKNNENETTSPNRGDSKPQWTSTTKRNAPQEVEFGLVELQAPLAGEPQDVKQYNVDIVAIHGLNGDVRRTWTHENGAFWLEDFLPNSMPGSRVFSYGYPSEVLFSKSIGGIRHYAQHLLASLEDVRESAAERRPIIYVCHSLGGIVLKQAMNVAFDNFRDVWVASKGVVFLGTPHRGSASADLPTLFGNIANVAWSVSGASHFRGGVNTALLRSLAQNSAELNTIGETFTLRAAALKIYTFYELNITQPVGTVIVEESSAKLGLSHERPIPLYADHRGLCRFASAESRNYKLVLARLVRMAEEISKELKLPTSSLNTDLSLDPDEKACMEVLNTVDIEGIESSLDRPIDGTLQWLSDNPEYTTWRGNTGPMLLLVTGYSGCGKTILSSYIIHSLTETVSSQTLVCRFFCDGKIQAQRDGSVLLRSLIYQIVRNRRKLLRLVKKACDFQGFHVFDRFDALWKLFTDLVRQEKAGPINIIIDAIDECEAHTQKLLMERIVEMIKSETVTWVKFFITSRPTTPAVRTLEDSSVQYIHLGLEKKQNVISDDVNLVIRKRLESLMMRGNIEKPARDLLEKILVDKADRTFLWVHLVLALLDKGGYLLLSNVQGFARQLPPNLPAVYCRFLQAISPSDIGIAGSLLRILVASAKPLKVDEISLLLAIRDTHESIASLDTGRPISRLDSVCLILGDLIRVHDSKVELAHQSLRDYLVDLSAQPSSQLSRDFGIDMQRERLLLAQSCIRYLTMNDFDLDLFDPDRWATAGSPDSPPSPTVAMPEQVDSDQPHHTMFDLEDDMLFKEESTIETEICTWIDARYPLYDYAATSWATLFAQSNDRASRKFHASAIALCDAQSHRSSNWFRYYWALNNPSESRPKTIDTVLIAAFFGQASTLRRVVENMTPRSHLNLGPALYWAARRGHTSCVELLLSHPWLECRSSIVNSQSPLAVASAYGHLDCVAILLDSGLYEINEQGPRGRTALSLASGNGFDRIVSVLLTNKNIDVNHSDYNGSSPLFAAVRMDFTSTITLLLTDVRTDPNHRNRRGQTPLALAAAESTLETIKTLLASHTLDANIPDSLGRSPLSHAAQHGRLDVVQHLVRSQRLMVSACDTNGRNAISWAASQPKQDVLHYLLKHDREGADKEDEDGWTPLAWTLNPPGYPNNVSELIQSGLVDINHRDRLYGRTALSFAVGYGYTTITQMMLQTEDVLPDLGDDDNRTPLSYAAAMGNLEIVKKLIARKGVEINGTDSVGRSPLSHAAGAGHVEVVRELIEVGGLDIEGRDGKGWAAVDWARENGKEDVAALLERC